MPIQSKTIVLQGKFHYKLLQMHEQSHGPWGNKNSCIARAATCKKQQPANNGLLL